MLVELSSTAAAEALDLNGDAGGCLMASTLQLKLLATLSCPWPIANLCQIHQNTALSCVISPRITKITQSSTH